MKRKKKFKFLILGILAAVILSACANSGSPSEKPAESQGTEAANADSQAAELKEVSVTVDYNYYQQKYMTEWIPMEMPKFYLDENRQKPVTDVEMEGNESLHTYKMKVPKTAEELYAQAPTINAIKECEEVWIPMADIEGADFPDFEIVSVSIPQMVEWKPYDEDFEVIIVLKPKNGRYPWNLKLEYKGRRYKCAVDTETENHEPVRVTYRFSISDDPYDAVTALKEGSLWYSKTAEFEKADQVIYVANGIKVIP